MNFNAIDRVGIEIEGGWTAQPPGVTVGHDGSVSVPGAPIQGEIKSLPMSRFDTVERYVLDNWPQMTHASCGLHIHISLRSQHHYACLMDKRFYDFFLARMQAFGTAHDIKNPNFWARLRGQNRFCERVWRPERQVEITYKDSVRYSQWNFCFAQHGTAECRMLPTFKKKELAVKAIREILTIVEEWLEKAPEAVEVEAVELVNE